MGWITLITLDHGVDQMNNRACCGQGQGLSYEDGKVRVSPQNNEEEGTSPLFGLGVSI